jgi:hypothetical protein
MFASGPQVAGAPLDRAQSLGIRAAFVVGDESPLWAWGCAKTSANAAWAMCWRPAPTTQLPAAPAAP